MAREHPPMTGKLIEQGPYDIENLSYDIETGCYERLATAYASAPEAVRVFLWGARWRGVGYLGRLVLTRRPR